MDTQTLSMSLQAVVKKQQSSIQHFLSMIELEPENTVNLNDINNFDRQSYNQNAIQKIIQKQQNAWQNFVNNLEEVDQNQEPLQNNQRVVFDQYRPQQKTNPSDFYGKKLAFSKPEQRESRQNNNNEFRIKKSKQRHSSHLKNKRQQLVKISLIATQQHNLRRKAANQKKIVQNLELLDNLRHRKNAQRANEWRGNFNQIKLQSLTERNLQKIAKMRKSLQKSSKSLSKKNPQASNQKSVMKTIESPSRKVPYNFYNIYKMYGDKFVLASGKN